jgi:beta-galactosidase
MSENMPESNRLHFGAAYYPEQWPEERWPEDIRLMREAGVSVVRMAEFAWSTMEPAEGEFHFEWLDRVIELLAANNIKTVLGTPTAAPPAWLVQHYPETVAVEETGLKVQFGNRCHYCVNSPEFHAIVQRTVSAMAEHFGHNPHVIGWQLDNEYGRVCYCEKCQGQFREYLAQQYGTLEVLNQRWTTAYWSQTYSAWEQIPIPIGNHNPGLMLEFKRFVTQSYKRFQKVQLDALRPHLNEGVWVTHNFMGWFEGFDHYEMSQDLDMASWDWYIGIGHNDHLRTNAIHDLTRGFKRRNFWVMETQPASVNWSGINNVLNPGEARSMAWQAVAHGADGLLYWQWRSALGGQEQYHGSLVDQSGQPRPFYKEAQQIGNEFAAVSPVVAGSAPKASVAMLNDYDSRWSIQWQRHHRDFDYVRHFNHYYRPLAARNVAVDILSAQSITSYDEIKKYRLIIAPALLIVSQQLADALKTYVSIGGHLVLTARTGMKDRYNALLPMRQPGLLTKIAGVEVEEYYALQDAVPVKGNWFEGRSEIWAERLKILNTSYCLYVAKYGKSNAWLDGQIGITINPIIRGFVYYVGAYLDPAAQDAMLGRFLQTAMVGGPFAAPEGVEVATRVKPDGSDVFFVINHKNEEVNVTVPWPAMDHISASPVEGALHLPPYGVAVLTKTPLPAVPPAMPPTAPPDVPLVIPPTELPAGGG